MDSKIQQYHHSEQQRQNQMISTKNEKDSTNKNPELSTKEISLKYQVYFIPIVDIQNQLKVVAFCPFTQISAYGASVEESAYYWTIQV